jgi:hypothetical protein
MLAAPSTPTPPSTGWAKSTNCPKPVTLQYSYYFFYCSQNQTEVNPEMQKKGQPKENFHFSPS